MAEFSRIRVTPAEDEDIVIRAGAVDQPVSEPPTDDSQGSATVKADVSAEEAPAASRRRDDAFAETTLEDLQRTSMSGMQKAIIALAIVAVVAFIIWYVLLR